MALSGLVVGYALCAVAVIYSVLALGAVWFWRRRRVLPEGGGAPVTVLKPLCGSEPLLYEHLRSFCDQDHGQFQIVFGVQNPEDPALKVVRRLLDDFPDADFQIAVGQPVHGGNRKVANLMHMFAQARHDRLVIADSDIRVGRDYLRAVTAPLADPGVGVVTCLYRGRPLPGVWSRLGALFINDWFLPSVLVSHAFGSHAFAFGATIALRRDALEAIGGFQSVEDQLADDYLLGELTRRQGLQTVLSPYLVDTLANEPGARALLRHELRWARTIKVLQPLGYAFSFLTYSLPLAVAGALLTGGSNAAVSLLGITVLVRVVLHYAVIGDLYSNEWPNLTLIAARDFLSFFVWCASFFGRTVWWQGRRLRVRRDGSVREHPAASRDK